VFAGSLFCNKEWYIQLKNNGLKTKTPGKNRRSPGLFDEVFVDEVEMNWSSFF
jgi:hypothetical protein